MIKKEEEKIEIMIALVNSDLKYIKTLVNSDLNSI